MLKLISTFPFDIEKQQKTKNERNKSMENVRRKDLNVCANGSILMETQTKPWEIDINRDIFEWSEWEMVELIL